ncbi:MAG: peroxide stress protein YaaA [Flavobacteriales bacterium]|nr:peroxide stress protein YaaA [Flavobacteriales bacterium]MBK6945055.1 peroxide stress protein YaaA [Flavobacteriales bacterium]MBK7239404.1 peroxide stress protein YaaA [Flavobacteriales bacterium]MBK9535390.1 peroxide stress protein YaaA [Flavobacteriales bacterium]MBP9137597.1 peroxide stress protein YaaA [Flavobacteriales bacterium]
MLLLLSPAKDLSTLPAPTVKCTTIPVLLEHSQPLVNKIRGFTAKRLSKLMGVNPKIAELNVERYQRWNTPFTQKNATPAAMLFNGEAYRGLDARSMDAADLAFAQHYLRILSGLYGVLRPLDLMQPYRLEMGTKLKVGRPKDLYGYWGTRISDVLKEDLVRSGSKAIINLASNEYSKVVQLDEFGVPVITPVFKDRVGAGYNMLMVYAKHQRGAMARHVIQHRILEPNKLKKYDGDGYRFSKEDSTETEFVFLRDTRQ